MLRFILRRDIKCQHSGAVIERFDTIDVDVPKLESALGRGGMAETGYDVTNLVGVEVIEIAEAA